MKLSFLLMICVASIFSVTHAASFNCERAQTKSEHAICEYLSLNDSDVKMATTYNILRKLVPMGTRSVIQEQQVKWLQLRDQCQDNVHCLTEVYKMRQQKLDLYMNKIYQQGPF